jgi:hypothetical protein
MLMVGLICNLSVRPVADKWFMNESELADEKRLAHENKIVMNANTENNAVNPTHFFTIMLAWIAVLLPLSWGTIKLYLT